MKSFNTDLPILDEIGRELEQLAAGSQPAPTRPPAPRRRGVRHGDRRGARITRRAMVVLVLLLLVGSVALAARFAGGGDAAPAHTAPTVLGRTGDAWRVSAYRDQGRLCLLLARSGTGLTSECGPAPGSRGVRATSLRAGRQRLVAGLTGERVGAVTVRSGGRTVGIHTHPASDPRAASEAGVPAGSRWFVVTLPHLGAASPQPAVVTPLDRDGRPLGRAYVDCSLGVVGKACARGIRAAASAAERGL